MVWLQVRCHSINILQKTPQLRDLLYVVFLVPLTCLKFSKAATGSAACNYYSFIIFSEAPF